MANTYAQIYIHAIFAVKRRECVITKRWRDELHCYISGILTNSGVRPLAVGGWVDHVHIFFELPLTTNVCDVMRVVKTNSSKWVNEQQFVRGTFRWQEGYWACSRQVSCFDTIIHYIRNQEAHHSKQSFKEEYVELLQEHNVEYDEKYLFDAFDGGVG